MILRLSWALMDPPDGSLWSLMGGALMGALGLSGRALVGWALIGPDGPGPFGPPGETFGPGP